jgi:hypothetical protein
LDYKWTWNVKSYQALKFSFFSLSMFVIYFIENIIKNYGWVLRKEWTHCGLLKWCHYVCHTYKIKNVNSKNMSYQYQKIKIKIGHHKMKNYIIKCIEIVSM